MDLRKNGGGNDDNGELLYSYLARRPFRYYDRQQTTKEIYAEDTHPNLRMQYPDSAAYRGKVYFLIDGRSFSVTAEFAAIAKSNNRGIFIGEETGGGYYGDISGDDVTVELPHSGMACRIPEVKYTLSVKKVAYPDRGVIPDYAVDASIEDFVDGSDSQLAKALSLVKQR
jgi:C-terminal processing protease CtpA/Prc